jgi:hypothetical protein
MPVRSDPRRMRAGALTALVPAAGIACVEAAGLTALAALDRWASSTAAEGRVNHGASGQIRVTLAACLPEGDCQQIDTPQARPTAAPPRSSRPPKANAERMLMRVCLTDQ